MKLHKLILCTLGCTLLLQMPLCANNSEKSYDGAGMCIAILDSGFTLTHESFVITNDAPKFTKDVCNLILDKTHAGTDNEYDTLFVSSKVPFAYDYGDNDNDVSGGKYTDSGTAMISIAAGNDGLLENPNPDAVGIAPEAQVLAMKVYSDKLQQVTESAMCAAIEDSITLGADVILIAIKEPCGFSESGRHPKLTEALKKADRLGIAVIAPAGDVISYGNDSLYYHEYEMSNVIADMVDVGTVAWPGSVDSVFSVGSSDTNTVTSPCFTLSDGRRIPYGDSTHLYKSVGDGKGFAQILNGKTVPYEIVNGIGTKEDFSAVGNLDGKIAVVDRGTITFNEKAKNAASAGAVGLIVIDNQPDRNAALTTRMDLSESPIPAIIISSASGKLLAASKEQTIFVDANSVYITETRPTETPSSFSAAGTTPELVLKPDITAVGRSVSCALPDGGYGTLNSTSASAAKVAGMYVCVKSKLLEKGADINPVSLMKSTKAVLASSAELMMQNGKDVPYSPRIQGSGSADLNRALDAEILLTVGGDIKAQCKDGYSRIVQFEITAHNISDTEKICTIDAVVGSDGFSSYTYEELDIENTDDPLYKRLLKDPSDTLAFIDPFTAFDSASVMPASHLYELNRFSESYSPYSFTLLPGRSETFEIIVYLDEATYKTYKNAFKNGFFMEGFVRVTCNESVYSLPFSAFSGNFASAPALDADLYGSTPAVFDGRYLYRSISDSLITGESRIVLGADTFGELRKNSVLSAESIAFSPKVDKNNSCVMLNFGLLRSVCDVTVTVSDPAGNVINRTEYGDLSRTYISDSTGMCTSVQLPIFTGRATDNTSYIYPDGIYEAKVEWRQPGTKRINSFSYSIYLDTSAPRFLSADFTKNGDGTVYLDVKAEDNHLIHTVTVTDGRGGFAYAMDDGTFDISELTSEYLYIDIFDCAANSVTVKVQNAYAFSSGS